RTGLVVLGGAARAPVAGAVVVPGRVAVGVDGDDPVGGAALVLGHGDHRRVELAAGVEDAVARQSVLDDVHGEGHGRIVAHLWAYMQGAGVVGPLFLFAALGVLERGVVCAAAEVGRRGPPRGGGPRTRPDMVASMQLHVTGPADLLPTRPHPTDAGLDLRSAVDVVLSPGAITTVPCGIPIALPQGTAGFIHLRSGLAA